MRQHIVIPEAAEELADGYRWYESRAPGTGRRFVDAVDGVVGRICEMPVAFPSSQHGTRSAKVFGFPYTVFFALEGELVVVYAVFHERRHPANRAGRGGGAP